jgi:hypothetical protein
MRTAPLSTLRCGLNREDVSEQEKQKLGIKMQRPQRHKQKAAEALRRLFIHLRCNELMIIKRKEKGKQSPAEIMW